MKKHKPTFQYGSGLHLDSNPYNFWNKEIIKPSSTKDKEEFDLVPLDRFRPFQSFVALTDQVKNDSTLQVVPGFHQYAEEYYQNTDKHGRNIYKWGTYSVKIKKSTDPLLDAKTDVQDIHRIPPGWASVGDAYPHEDLIKVLEFAELHKVAPLDMIEKVRNDQAANHIDAVFIVNRIMTTLKVNSTLGDSIRRIRTHRSWFMPGLETIVNKISAISDEHKAMASKTAKPTGNEIKQGDFVIWDVRTPHQNGHSNSTDKPRQVFYHAYLAAIDQVNKNAIEHIAKCRLTSKHISDFSKVFSHVEDGTKPTGFEDLGMYLYDQEQWTARGVEMFKDPTIRSKVTQRHIDYLKRYGYVVIENVVDVEQVTNLKNAISSKLTKHGVDLTNQVGPMSASTWNNFTKISNPFGGMVEFFWLPEQEAIRQSTTSYNIMAEIMQHTWCSDTVIYKHPYGDKMVAEHLWVYCDRINYRFPSIWRPIEPLVKSPKKKKASGVVAGVPKKKRQSKLFERALKSTRQHEINFKIGLGSVAPKKL